MQLLYTASTISFKKYIDGKTHPQVFKAPQPRSLLLVLILGIAIISALVHDAYFYSGHRHHARQTDAPINRNANNAPQTDTPIDWNSIRYLWLGQEYA